MKALVIAESSSSAVKLAGGARAFGADDVSLVCFEDVVPDASDTSILLTVPDGALVDDARPDDGDARLGGRPALPRSVARRGHRRSPWAASRTACEARPESGVVARARMPPM